ncbi:exodeoxyribonuclease VII large subunit [Brucepastera parasyntrophica]|uniref:exodeoxyribonuclease VII large subunit n=1 Tax=Brucepastera parasyntrophica TaxID=2880008 RepID=UPI00210C3C88|nr:exodeoxyribonuclease VII large subunit [Brucepastera parasyntrophica]ULQ60136.1 exodeoxyribonuclease VII large subunit [Brucepastera parasyntrophica]
MLSIKPLKISEITASIKNLLENSFGTVLLEGEISNFRPSSTGHLYFTLKDESSAISAVMFKGKSRYLPFVPKEGLLVHAVGNISVYDARGTYQIIIDSMEAAGSGDIFRLIEERKQKLAEEGLFDQERKRPLPAYPRTIAVITSPTGAAVRDIIQIISRRNPSISIIILPAQVQGAEAPEAIVRQIETANYFKMADILIIGRGGGSMEDLLPFSDEEVVRAVAHSDIPVVSAVGHETDWALSDFAADVRAPTPSAAAELVSPILEDIIAAVQYTADEMVFEMNRRIERIRLMMSQFSAESMEMRFRRIEQPVLLRFDDAKEDLLRSFMDRIRDTKQHINLLAEKLEGGNPQSILKRGYSMVRDEETGKVIRNSDQTTPGQKLVIIPERGKIHARVE